MNNVVDIYPNEVIEREANEAELAAREELHAATEARIAADSAKETAKAAALAKLGLTAEELTALL